MAATQPQEDYTSVSVPELVLPKIGQIENGYRFGGGDPANPASWAKLPEPGSGKEPGTWDRMKQGVVQSYNAGKIAATNDPQDIAGIVSDEQLNSLPATAAQKLMAEEIKPYQAEATNAEGVVDTVTAWSRLAAKRLSQLVSNPKEFVGMMAENLPNSAPGLIGGVMGAAAGGAVGGPVGAVVGGVAGGTAGGYAMEQGSAMRDQILQEAQARGVDPRDPNALEPIVRENYEKFLAASRLKGVGTAGTDAILNVVTVGVAGAGERALVKELALLRKGASEGTISAADALLAKWAEKAFRKVLASMPPTGKLTRLK